LISHGLFHIGVGAFLTFVAAPAEATTLVGALVAPYTAGLGVFFTAGGATEAYFGEKFILEGVKGEQQKIDAITGAAPMCSSR